MEASWLDLQVEQEDGHGNVLLVSNERTPLGEVVGLVVQIEDGENGQINYMRVDGDLAEDLLQVLTEFLTM